MLIATDVKRIQWPLGMIVEASLPRSDGHARIAKVQTAESVRPFQELYPLEATSKKNILLRIWSVFV